VLREADGAGAAPASGLATQLYRATGGADWDRVRAYVYGGGRGAVAALVPRVAQAAADGDDGARAILAWAGEELGRLARLLLRRCGGARPVALAGGVARVGGALEASFRASLPAGVEVRVLTDEPVRVAARLARAAAVRGAR
jgi:N-acetylglucosamine kinase-like BadF-type ATPase